MFGNVIYYDKKQINEYKSVIKGQKNLEIDEYQVSNDKGFQFDFKAIGADAKASKTYIAKVNESLLYNCDEFEKLLENRDDFFDFTQSDFDLDTLGRGVIIKFDGYLSVPEEFDLTQTLDKFKSVILDSMFNDGMDKSEQDIVKAFFETSDLKIPVVVDFDKMVLCSKLLSNNLLVRYEEMEEYEELEVTIIARITSSKKVNAEKSFYDPLKDFIKLNRTMRRSIDGRTDGLYEIFADDDYRTIEILAIYQ